MKYEGKNDVSKSIQELIQGLKQQEKEYLNRSRAMNIPVGAGRLSDDLSKVADSDVIGKGGESDLRK
jgi:hypothetical protein